MNTELLKSKLLEAAFNGSLTHADTSTWENVQLGEIGTIVTGSTPSKANSEFYGNDYPFYKPGDLDQGINTDKSVDGLSKIGYEHARHLPANSILVTCIGSIGKTGLIRREGSCNQQINAIIPNDKCNCFYVYYLMISSAMQEKMNFLSRSMTMAILNKSKFSCMEIPLPPLAEQQRIVDALEEGFAYIDAVASAKQNLSDSAELLRSKILQAALRGMLVHQNENDEPVSYVLEKIRKTRSISKSRGETKACDDKIIEYPYDIPNHWAWVRFSEYIDVRDGTHESPRYHIMGIPFVTSKNLKDGKIDFSSCKLISQADHEKFSKRSCVDDGDILYAMIGSIGNPVIVRKDRDFSIKNVALFKPYVKELTNMHYVYYYLLHIQENLKQNPSGGLQPFIGLNTFRNYLLPLPPLAEQQRIVAKIEELFTQIDKITK